MRWAEIYTYSVVSEVASARREELLSDLHEQYAAGARRGLSPMAVSRSIVWRAIRGIPADLRWGAAHHYQKGKVLETTAGNHRGRSIFQGANVLWIILAAAFLIGIGATVAEYFVHGDILGRVYVGPAGFGVSGILVLTSAVAFLVVRVVQLIGQAWSKRRLPDL